MTRLFVGGPWDGRRTPVPGFEEFIDGRRYLPLVLVSGLTVWGWSGLTEAEILTLLVRHYRPTETTP